VPTFARILSITKTTVRRT